MPKEIQRPQPLLVLGSLLSLSALAVIAFLLLRGHVVPRAIGPWLFANVEWIGLASLGSVLVFVLTFDRLSGRRRITYLPLDAAWWEYMVMGAIVVPITLAWLLGLFGAFVILPFVAPFKVVYSYTLGPSASLISTVVAIPLVFLSVSLAFALLYAGICNSGRGALLRDGVLLFQKDIRVGWMPSAVDTFYYSSSIIVLGAADGFQARGMCRWISLFQGLVGKLLEVVIVAIGLGIVFTRFASRT